MRIIFHTLCVLLLVGCGSQSETPKPPEVELPAPEAEAAVSHVPKTAKTVHVFVALCDNKSQGIVPVPSQLGNGDDPDNNLYWGAMYGTKSFLKRSKSWSYIKGGPGPDKDIIERIVLKHTKKEVFLIADAYRGSRIKKAMIDFLRAAGGGDAATLKEGEEILGLSGNADLVVFVGHNGLMDNEVAQQTRTAKDGGRQAMVLACKSKPYFQPRLEALGSRCVLLTTGLMAPEAYTLDAAVSAWISGGPAERIREQAAAAYNRYQKCGMTGARRLFYSEK